MNARVAILQDNPSRLVTEMATTLYAAIRFGGLNTASDCDVIQCLREAPERYNQQDILNNYKTALYEAKQTLIAIEMSDR